MLARIQNDLFDLGADLATPDTGKTLGYEPLRIVAAQVDAARSRHRRAQRATSQPLRSFVLPGGSPAAAALHLARTVARRAERLMVELAADAGRDASTARRIALHQPRCPISCSSPPASSMTTARPTCYGFRARTAEPRCGAEASAMFIPLHDANSLKHIKAAICHDRPDRGQCHRLSLSPALGAARTSPSAAVYRPRLHPLRRLRLRRAAARTGRSCPEDADLRHLCLPARRHLPSRRQHAVPVGVRRQCRGCAGPFPLPGLLSPLRRRRRAASTA